MNLVFLGTPEFALPSLKALYDSEHKILAVICQPDKPRGRNQLVTPTPAKAFAAKKGLKILTPLNLGEPGFLSEYKALNPEINVVVAYGRIMPGWLIDYPARGTINVHPSLLPKYRGPAPMARALMAGDAQTGTTVQYVVEETDAGNIILQEKLKIEAEDNNQTLSEKLAKISADLLLKALKLIEENTFEEKRQDETKVIYAPKITKEELRLSFEEPSEKLFNKIRGLAPRPGAYLVLKEKRLKILKAEVNGNDGRPGEIVAISKEGILVGTKDKTILLKTVQAEGGRAMDAFEFAKGHRIEKGAFIK